MSEFALREGAERGDLEMVQKVIAEGVDVNGATMATGLTALHKAAIRGRVQVVIELVQAGADIHRETGAGATALQLAEEAGFWEVADALKAAQAGTLRTVASALESPARPSARERRRASSSLGAGSSASALRSPRMAASLTAPESYVAEDWYSMQEHRKRREKRRAEFTELMDYTRKAIPTYSAEQPSGLGATPAEQSPRPSPRVGQASRTKPWSPKRERPRRYQPGGMGSTSPPPPSPVATPAPAPAVEDRAARRAAAAAASDKAKVESAGKQEAADDGRKQKEAAAAAAAAKKAAEEKANADAAAADKEKEAAAL
jgi:hypothetical protein